MVVGTYLAEQTSAAEAFLGTSDCQVGCLPDTSAEQGNLVVDSSWPAFVWLLYQKMLVAEPSGQV